MTDDAGLNNLIVLAVLAPYFLILPWWSIVRVIRRAGYGGWWALLLLIPVVSIVAIWVFAYSEWPRHKRAA